MPMDKTHSECIPDDIEVTPEMIEAAEGLLFSFDRERAYASDCLCEIYQAMEAARRAGLRKHDASADS